MLVLAITHPDSAARSPRTLSEGGRQQALLAARRLRELVGKKVSIAGIVSSPKARCVETAIIVARELGETTREDHGFDRVEAAAELEEKNHPIDPAHFDQLLASTAKRMPPGESAVLVSLHGDLANVVLRSSKLIPGAARDGWFEARPVIAVLEFDSEKTTVRTCEKLHAGAWINCIADG